MIKDWILEYKPKNEEQILNAPRRGRPRLLPQRP
jgi:hypothetical protein